jgi:hypothetical protein
VAVKAKLTVVRQKLRELDAKMCLVKQQGQFMSKNHKDAREEGRRAGEVVGLKEDEAGARAAAGVGRPRGAAL